MINRILLSFTLLLVGCASVTSIHPIFATDIFPVEIGTQIGNTIVQKDGWFVSDDYMKQVMDVKVGR